MQIHFGKRKLGNWCTAKTRSPLKLFSSRGNFLQYFLLTRRLWLTQSRLRPEHPDTRKTRRSLRVPLPQRPPAPQSSDPKPDKRLKRAHQSKLRRLIRCMIQQQSGSSPVCRDVRFASFVFASVFDKILVSRSVPKGSVDQSWRFGLCCSSCCSTARTACREWTAPRRPSCLRGTSDSQKSKGKDHCQCLMRNFRSKNVSPLVFHCKLRLSLCRPHRTRQTMTSVCLI